MALFENEYQGGNYVELFTPQGSNPLANWKVTGKDVEKIYDRGVKGFILSSIGPGCKLQLPKDDKKLLGLVHPFLVLQVFLPAGQPFALEIGVADTEGSRRRLFLSTSFMEVKITPLHCQVPLPSLERGTWLHLVVPCAELVGSLFRGITFRCLDLITISGPCKLRRILTLRQLSLQSPADDPGILPLPRGMEYPMGVRPMTQVLHAGLLAPATRSQPATATGPRPSQKPSNHPASAPAGTSSKGLLRSGSLSSGSDVTVGLPRAGSSVGPAKWASPGRQTDQRSDTSPDVPQAHAAGARAVKSGRQPDRVAAAGIPGRRLLSAGQPQSTKPPHPRAVQGGNTGSSSQVEGMRSPAASPAGNQRGNQYVRTGLGTAAPVQLPPRTQTYAEGITGRGSSPLKSPKRFISSGATLSGAEAKLAHAQPRDSFATHGSRGREAGAPNPGNSLDDLLHVRSTTSAGDDLTSGWGVPGVSELQQQGQALLAGVQNMLASITVSRSRYTRSSEDGSTAGEAASVAASGRRNSGMSPGKARGGPSHTGLGASMSQDLGMSADSESSRYDFAAGPRSVVTRAPSRPGSFSAAAGQVAASSLSRSNSKQQPGRPRPLDVGGSGNEPPLIQSQLSPVGLASKQSLNSLDLDTPGAWPHRLTESFTMLAQPLPSPAWAAMPPPSSKHEQAQRASSAWTGPAPEARSSAAVQAAHGESDSYATARSSVSSHAPYTAHEPYSVARSSTASHARHTAPDHSQPSSLHASSSTASQQPRSFNAAAYQEPTTTTRRVSGDGGRMAAGCLDTMPEQHHSGCHDDSMDGSDCDALSDPVTNLRSPSLSSEPSRLGRPPASITGKHNSKSGHSAPGEVDESLGLAAWANGFGIEEESVLRASSKQLQRVGAVTPISEHQSQEQASSVSGSHFHSPQRSPGAPSAPFADPGDEDHMVLRGESSSSTLGGGETGMSSSMDRTLGSSRWTPQPDPGRHQQRLSREGRSYHLDAEDQIGQGAWHDQRAFTPPVVPPGRARPTASQPQDAGKGNGAAGAAGQAGDVQVLQRSTLSGNAGDGFMDLVYDPILNCYFDPRTNQYYALK